jgi:hypothetical protein
VGGGKGGEGTDVDRCLPQHRLHRRELAAELPGDGVELIGDRSGVGLAKTVRMAAAIISWEPLGTRARTL